MKIVVYSHDSHFYGANQALYELTNFLQIGNEVIYIIPKNDIFENMLQNRQYVYKILPNPQWVLSSIKQGYNRWYYFKHVIKTFIIFITSILKAYKKNIQAIKEINPDLIFVNTSTAPLGLIIAKHLRIKSIMWVHESLCNKTGVKVSTVLPRKFVGIILRKADVILGPSEYLKNQLLNTFGITNTQILPNIISYKPELKQSSQFFTFGLVGSLSERKGQYEFAKAMLKNNKDATLVIYGGIGNVYSKKIIKLSNQNQGKVVLKGYESNLNVIYSSFDIYVNMGIDETFGRTTIEAMRAGKLVFGRNSGATPELIQHGKNGFLFNNVDEIFTILNMYNSIDKSSVINAIKEQAKEFSLNYTASNIIKNFKICLN